MLYNVLLYIIVVYSYTSILYINVLPAHVRLVPDIRHAHSCMYVSNDRPVGGHA